MTSRPTTPAGRSRGFTLIELLVAMLIIAILGSMALSSYMNQSRKSRRTEARTALLDLAGREERNFSTTNLYSSTPSQLGYTGAAFPITVGSGYYSVNVAVTAPVAGGALATYTLVATAIGDQVKDTNCQTFTVTQTGSQTSTNSGGADSTATCWH